MKCKSPGCRGKINPKVKVGIRIVYPDYDCICRANPCTLCGKLHFSGGKPVIRPRGAQALPPAEVFLKAGGKIAYRCLPIEEEPD